MDPHIMPNSMNKLYKGSRDTRASTTSEMVLVCFLPYTCRTLGGSVVSLINPLIDFFPHILDE